MSRLLVLYHRNGCHLCEQMLAELHGLYGQGLAVTLVDVDSNADLYARYSQQVPVLMGGGRLLSSGRLDCASVEAYLAGN